jgi:hypothetical protein
MAECFLQQARDENATIYHLAQIKNKITWIDPAVIDYLVIPRSTLNIVVVTVDYPLLLFQVHF